MGTCLIRLINRIRFVARSQFLIQNPPIDCSYAYNIFQIPTTITAMSCIYIYIIHIYECIRLHKTLQNQYDSDSWLYIDIYIYAYIHTIMVPPQKIPGMPPAATSFSRSPWMQTSPDALRRFSGSTRPTWILDSLPSLSWWLTVEQQ